MQFMFAGEILLTGTEVADLVEEATIAKMGNHLQNFLKILFSDCRQFNSASWWHISAIVICNSLAGNFDCIKNCHRGAGYSFNLA